VARLWEAEGLSQSVASHPVTASTNPALEGDSLFGLPLTLPLESGDSRCRTPNRASLELLLEVRELLAESFQFAA
jgi:hypothetical protein